MTAPALSFLLALLPQAPPPENTIRFHNDRVWSSTIEFPNFRAGGNVAGDRIFKIWPESLLLAPGGQRTLSAWSVPIRFHGGLTQRLPDGEWRRVRTVAGRVEPDLSAPALLLNYTGTNFTFQAPGDYQVTYRLGAGNTRVLPVGNGGFAFALVATPGEGVASCTGTPTSGVHVFLSSRERYPSVTQAWSGAWNAQAQQFAFYDGTTSQCAPLPAGELYADMRFVEPIVVNRNQSAWAYGSNPLPRDEGVGSLFTNLATIGGLVAWQVEDRARAGASLVVLPLLNTAQPAGTFPLPGGVQLRLNPADPLLFLLLELGVASVLPPTATGETVPFPVPMDPSLWGADLFVGCAVIDAATLQMTATQTTRTRID